MLNNAFISVHIIDHMGNGGAQEMLRVLKKEKNIHIISLRKKKKIENFSPISFLPVYKQIKNISPKVIHIHLQKIFFLKIIFLQKK